MTESNWQPAASLERVRARAGMYAAIRAFFTARGVLEVDTPVVSAAAPTDPNIHSLRLESTSGPRYLATSPEFPMKRLLAAGSGDIYQIAPVFRADECGRWHEPEFRMLEWYRVGMNHLALMQEVEALVNHLRGTTERFDVLTYAEACREYAAIDVTESDTAALTRRLEAASIAVPEGLERDGLLDLLMGTIVGPALGAERPCFVIDYPASQASLARIRPGDPPVAERFELYWQGVELANGFHELCDPSEQRRRFEDDLAVRQSRGQPMPVMDQNLLAALEAGLPDCAGVALGLDRLLMLLTDAGDVQSVTAFPGERA